MSAKEDPTGVIEKVYSLPANKFLGLNLDPPETVFEGLFNRNRINQVLVDPGVPWRRFAVYLACSMAGAEPFVTFPATIPRKTWYVSAAAEPYSEQLRFHQHLKTLSPTKQRVVQENLSIYQRSFEGDGVLGIEQKEGQKAFADSRPEECDHIVVDDISALAGRYWNNRDRQTVEEWARHFAMSNTLIYFQVGSRPSRLLREADALNTVYLEYDPAAPSTFGGGFLLHRHREHDADHLPKTVSVWHTVIDGKLCWEHAIPGAEGRDLKDIKATELKLKVAKMKLYGANGKETAVLLKTSESAVCRALKEFDSLKKTAAEKVAQEKQEAIVAGTPTEEEAVQLFLQEHRSRTRIA